jgi:hypothetical protein
MVSGLHASSQETAGAGAPKGCKPCGAAGMATAGKARRGERRVDYGVLGLRGIFPRRAGAADPAWSLAGNMHLWLVSRVRQTTGEAGRAPSTRDTRRPPWKWSRAGARCHTARPLHGRGRVGRPLGCRQDVGCR